jgi:hypothetical protein
VARASLRGSLSNEKKYGFPEPEFESHRFPTVSKRVKVTNLMNPHVSSSSDAAPAPEARSSSDHDSSSPSPGKARRRKQRPRTWARRMKQRMMPLFWILIALLGLYFVVRTVLTMTALQ